MLVLVHPLDFSTYHLITHHVILCAMDHNQRRIGEFVALSGKKKSPNTGARLNITSGVIMIDCSDDSDSQEIEATTCLSVSADVPVRQFSDSNVKNEVENEKEIQLVPQVSAVRQQSVKKSNEETVSEVDSSRSLSSLVDKPKGSLSIARDTTFDSAIGCSTSNGCD